jgi:uncharacterized protein (TIGR00251 family)
MTSSDIDAFIEQTREALRANSLCFLRVKALPSASVTAFVSVMEGEERTIKISVAAPAEKWKANKELCKFLGKYFSCECEIVSGGGGSLKLIKLKSN